MMPEPKVKHAGQLIRAAQVDNGRAIRVYDNVFDMQFRNGLYSFALASKFSIGWADSEKPENRLHQNLHCVFSTEDVERSGVLGRLATTPVAQEFDGHKLEKCVINLSTASDVNFVHSHPEDKVLLYYLNLEWRDGWHGETLFYDETGKEVVFANAYTPNRLVAFDAKIPHTIRPQSHLAPQYRLTLALIYNKC
jgi:hypothetical protein